MNTAEIRRAAEALPLTVESLRALIGAAESFALALQNSGEVTGADVVHDACLDAWVACDDIYAIEPEELTQRERDDATDWLITRDKEERSAA